LAAKTTRRRRWCHGSRPLDGQMIAFWTRRLDSTEAVRRCFNTRRQHHEKGHAMLLNIWLKLAGGLAGGIAKGLYSDYRGKSKLNNSIVEQEQELVRYNTTLWNGLFDHPGGVFALTNRNIRFEKTMSSTGKMAKGSTTIPLSEVRNMTVGRAGLFGGSVTIVTSTQSFCFQFMSMGRAKDVHAKLQAIL
jgi:hypothetical protein